MDKAELVLYKQKENIRTLDLSKEFYKIFPFTLEQTEKSIQNKRVLHERFELCQVLRDMISITEETDWDIRASLQSIARSINAYIKCLDINSSDYLNIKNVILNCNGSTKGMPIIHNVYEIKRPNETLNFNKQGLDNVKLLFHGSKVNNFIGILSRGILLPKNILENEENNLTQENEFHLRTDIGNLGWKLF